MHKLKPLTSLRFFAAFAIVLHHVNGSFGVPQIAGVNLAAGVSFFFVLSGFILTYVYPDLPSRAVTFQFLIARIARVWPAYIVGMVVALFINPEQRSLMTMNLPTHLLTNILMIQTWVPLNWYNFSFDGPEWSISTEFAFYLLFPFLLINLRRTWWIKLILSFLLILALVETCVILHAQPSKSQFDGITTYAIFYLHPIVRVFEFIVGMCAAVVWTKVKPFLKMPVLLGTLVEIGALLSVAFYTPVAGILYQYVSFLHSEPATVWYNYQGALILPFALVIFVMASELGWIGRALSISPLVILGEISYSIYILHVPIASAIAFNAPQGTPEWIKGVLFFSIVFTSAYLVWKWVELPARAALRRMPARAKIAM